MYKIFICFFSAIIHSLGQYSKPEVLPVLEKEFVIEDYWEAELSPVSNLEEIVRYIHHDPFKTYFISNIPAGNPLLREISVNSFYGARNHPVHGVVKFHRGIDLKGTKGEKVIASGNGKVISSGYKSDLGNFIKIQHKYGFESTYGHLSSVKVKVGQSIVKNQVIGKVGSSGKVTGPHLHYTLKKNEAFLDPFDFIFMNFQKEF
jgi:murein DD-endopeptidase MepM/ murein hydrolase activator NlpD